VIVGTMLAERENLAGYLADVGLPALLFCLVSLSVGFVVPRALGVVRGQAVASSFEIGVHNSTLAITIAISVLDSPALAVPAAVYGVLMFPVAAAFGWLITRRTAADREVQAAG
jgi:bile acid:Na+ symporter, BASS family